MADVASALKEATDKMNKAVEVAKDDFGAIRTGRAQIHQKRVIIRKPCYR